MSESRFILTAAEFGIDLELTVNPGGTGIILLPKHTCTAAIAAAVVAPTNHKTAVINGGNRRFVLVAGCAFIDPELLTQRRAICRKVLAKYAPGRGIQSGPIRPGHHKGAVSQARHHRLPLITGHSGVHQKLATHRVTSRVVALGKNALAAAVTGRTGGRGRPGNNKTATSEAAHTRLILE